LRNNILSRKKEKKESDLGLGMESPSTRSSGGARNFIEVGQKIYCKTLLPSCR